MSQKWTKEMNNKNNWIKALKKGEYDYSNKVTINDEFSIW